MIRKRTPSIDEEVASAQLGGYPGANEGIDDHQIRVPVTQLRDAAAAIRAAHFDPAAGRKRQVPTDERGELDVRLEHYLSRGRAGRGQVPRQGHARATHVDYAFSLTRRGHAIDDVGQPLHVIELEPQWIVEVDV